LLGHLSLDPMHLDICLPLLYENVGVFFLRGSFFSRQRSSFPLILVLAPLASPVYSAGQAFGSPPSGDLLRSFFYVCKKCYRRPFFFRVCVKAGSPPAFSPCCLRDQSSLSFSPFVRLSFYFFFARPTRLQSFFFFLVKALPVTSVKQGSGHYSRPMSISEKGVLSWNPPSPRKTKHPQPSLVVPLPLFFLVSRLHRKRYLSPPPLKTAPPCPLLPFQCVDVRACLPAILLLTFLSSVETLVAVSDWLACRILAKSLLNCDSLPSVRMLRE